MDDKAKAWIEESRQRVPDVNGAAQLAREFRVLLWERQSDELSNLIAQATQI